MKKYSILLFLFIFFICPSFAQVPSNPLGLNPFKLKWNQINTDKVQVIFPQGLEKEGQRVANLIHYILANKSESIGTTHKKASIFLQNQTTIPNGFVTVGPFRSEFFLTPPQLNLGGASNWLDLLAIHEYRHIQQFANANKGVSKLTRIVLGSWAWGGVVGTALPRWFFEGDAVVAETTLSKGGRGRLPNFDMEYKALVLNNKTYNYEKASAGSLKDFVPSHYHLGYYIVASGRKRFGKNIWADVLEDAIKYKGLLYPFSRNLKKKTGLRTPQLYYKTMQDLDSMWKIQDSTLVLTENKQLNTNSKTTFTSYQNAHYLKDGKILVEKSSFRQIPTLYVLDNTGKEKRLLNIGISSNRNRYLSVSKNKVCWAERSTHARWGYENYSVIRTYDFRSGEKTQITKQSKYFAPALSSDGEKIVTIEIPESMRAKLIILNANSGAILQKLPNPQEYFYTFPRFTEDNQKIVVVAQKNEKQHIALIDLQTGQEEMLSNPSNFPLTNPFQRGKHIYFSSAYTGINNIFALDIESKKIWQVTSSRLGAFQPSVSWDNQKLLYSEFDMKGYNLKEIEIKPNTWKKYNPEIISPSEITYYKSLVTQEGDESVLSTAPSEEFDIKKYNKWSGLINPHSILPYLLPPVAGIQILSDNKFSTLSARLGAFYNNNEDEFTYNASLSYAELFPVINANYNRSNRTRNFLDIRRIVQEADTSYTLLSSRSWTEDNFAAGLSLPINYTRGTFFNRLDISANYHWINIQDAPIANAENILFQAPIQNEMLNALDLRFRVRQIQNRERQNLNPRFAQILDIRYRTTVGNSLNSGAVFSVRADLFFPAFKRTHSFYINLAYQEENIDNTYKFPNFFFYSRGYQSVVAADNVSKIGFNYSLPLLYPDISLGSFVFLKRVKANLFYDYTSFERRAFPVPSTRLTFLPVASALSSVGGEITFDIRAFRLLEIDLGFRYSFLIEFEDTQIDFLLLNIGI